MDKQTLIISQGMQDLIKQNKETNAQLRELNQPSDLGASTRENLGEILTSIATSQREIRNETDIAKGHNLGIGVTAKNGIDIVPGGEPSVDEKDTLYGITKEFYGKQTIGNLVESTKEVSKNVLDFNTNMQKSLQKLNDDRNKDSAPEKKTKIGFFKGLAKTSGLTSKVRGIKKFSTEETLKKSFKKLGKFIAPVRIGMAIGKVLGAPFRLIGRGFSTLKNKLSGLLKGVLKGIISLPKKLLSFVGSTFSMLGKIAMLGLGVFGLSKLSEFLRNVTPEQRREMIESFVEGTKSFITALGEVKDFIMKDFIPILKEFMYAFLNNPIVKFFFGGMYGAEINKLLESRDRKEVITKANEQIVKTNEAVTKIRDDIDEILAIPEGERTLSQRAKLKARLEMEAKQKKDIEKNKAIIKSNEQEVQVDEEGNAIKIRTVIYAKDKAIAKALRQDLSEIYKFPEMLAQVNDRIPSGAMIAPSVIAADNSTNLTQTNKMILLQSHYATTYK